VLPAGNLAFAAESPFQRVDQRQALQTCCYRISIEMQHTLGVLLSGTEI
jgi:hypothetical protein